MLNKYKFFILLIGVFFIALFLRVYNLDSVPYGFHIDEAKVAWNAFSIMKTGMDDKGNKLPLYYDSFGDFRPTGLIYFIIPFLTVFGNTILAVRFPFALVGALTVFPLYLFILKISEKRSKFLALIGAILLAFNPWHIIASRATSESIVVLFLTLFGLYFFIKLIKSNSYVNMLLSYFCLIISFFFYHNIRVLAPIFVFVILFFYKVVFLQKVKIKPLLLLVLLFISTTLIFLSPQARGRMSQVSLKSDFKVLYEVTKMPTEEGSGHVFIARAFHNRMASYIRRFAEEYKEYFGTTFLTGESVKPVRYSIPYVGLLTYFELILIILGLFFVSKRKEILIVLALLVVAPLPAAATIEDVPNMQRAIFMVPFLLIIAAYGFYELTKLQSKWKYLSILIALGYFLNFIYFSHMYFVHQKMSIATYYRDGGNLELIKKLSEIKDNYKKIVLTNSPDDLYPWFAFLQKIDPLIFNSSYKTINGESRNFENVVFSKDKCPLNIALDKNDLSVLDNVLFIDAEGCVVDRGNDPKMKVILVETIFRPDGSPPYYFRTVDLIR